MDLHLKFKLLLNSVKSIKVSSRVFDVNICKIKLLRYIESERNISIRKFD